MRFPNFNLKTRQQGAATLIVVMVLAIIMGIIALTTARTGLMEQKITGNDLRAREAQEAAEAGLEYGVAWAQDNPIPATITCSSGSLPTGCPTALTTVTDSSTSTKESYVYTLTYTKGGDSVKVTSSARGVADSSIAATSEAWVKSISYLTKKGLSAPPFVINGGLSNVTGNPEIHTGDPPATAIVTSQPVGAIDTGFFNKKTSSPPLGDTISDTFPATTTPAWDYLFKISLASATSIAIDNGYDFPAHALPTTPESGKEPFYVWDSDFKIGENYGSATDPVVIIIQNGHCPKINGSPIIYGFVYFPASCSDQGWGGATIYGTIISEGSITKVTANAVHVGSDTGGGGGNIFSNFVKDVARIPGTWKDF